MAFRMSVEKSITSNGVLTFVTVSRTMRWNISAGGRCY